MHIPFTNIEIPLPQLFKRGGQYKSVKIETGVEEELTPVKAGRSSVSQYVSMIKGGVNFGTIQPKVRKEFLDILEELSIWNGDVSNAAENIVKLANRPHLIHFAENTPDTVAKKAQEYITKKEKDWYRGGITSLKNDLLTQLAVFGAISAEKVIRPKVNGLQKVALVPHQFIVFKEENDEFQPYQNIANFKNQGASFGETKLNTFTYKYLSLTRINSNPYAIPPMLAALREIDIDDYLVDNLRFVARKHGVLGFLSVLVNAPAKKQNETPELYWQRCEDYLKKITPQIEKGYRDGIAIGFKNAHEFKVQNSTSDGNGARDIVELVDQKKMSGLKQDPIFFGRPFNTSEAIGRVIFEKWTGQLESYQNILATFLADVYFTELILAGFPIESLTVEFEKPNTKDKLRDAQATQLEIMNIITLRDEGIIGQQQAAKALNYDRPFKEAPDKTLKPTSTAPANQDNKTK